jgi:predicted nucleotidyltransferase
MTVKDGDLLHQISQIVDRFPSVELALVYGSLAKGGFHESSDIDLAVAKDGVMGVEEKVDLINAVSRETGREVDLLDLNEATGTVFKQAIESGLVIKGANPRLLARILSRLAFEEADFQKLRSKLMRERRRRIFSGT